VVFGDGNRHVLKIVQLPEDVHHYFTTMTHAG
jgi:hypothetical protein